MSVKRSLIGRRVGRLAIAGREAIRLVDAALRRPAVAGTLTNDYLAGMITARLCREGMTFLDIGAHIGSVTDAVSRNCPRSRVVAFEAIPEKVEHLRRKFPRVECHDCALGETEGEATFFVDLRASGYSSLGKPQTRRGSKTVEIRVLVRRLDSFGDLGEVDVAKLDVEGAELGVLRGGEGLIGRCRPVILFESGPTVVEGLGYTKEALWEWFQERNYAVLVPNRLAYVDPGLGREGFVESHLFPRRTTNYFAVPRERRDEVRRRARGILGLPGD